MTMNEKHIMLKEQGFVVIPDVLSSAECDRFKGLLEDAHATYSGLYANNAATGHRLNYHTDEKIVYNRHNKHPDFLRLIDHPAAFDTVEPYLQEGSYRNADPIILRQNTARCPLRGKEAQQLHVDSRLPGLPYSLMVVVAWPLDEFTRISARAETPETPQDYALPDVR